MLLFNSWRVCGLFKTSTLSTSNSNIDAFLSERYKINNDLVKRITGTQCTNSDMCTGFTQFIMASVKSE